MLAFTFLKMSRNDRNDSFPDISRNEKQRRNEKSSAKILDRTHLFSTCKSDPENRAKKQTGEEMKKEFLCETDDLFKKMTELGHEATLFDIVKATPDDFTQKDVVFVSSGDKQVQHTVRLLAEYGNAYELRLMNGAALLQQKNAFVASAIVQRAVESRPVFKYRRSLLENGIERFAEEPPAQTWAVKGPASKGGLLPGEDPILLAGRGGIGKTTAAVELALLSSAWDGNCEAPEWMGQKVAQAGVGVVLTYEETTARMHRKMKAMCAHHNINPETVGTRCVVKSFQDVDSTSEPLIALDPKTRQPVPTSEYDRLTQELRALQAAQGSISVVVVDNVGTAFAVEGNSYQDANQAMKWVQRWAAEFNCLVIVVAHTNKTASTSRTRDGDVVKKTDDEILNTVMGSTGWISAVRAVMVMWQMEEHEEDKLAETLKDPSFVKGETRRRYIHAQILKENTDDIYTGRLTLKRENLTLQDVSKKTKKAYAQASEKELKGFAQAIGRVWHLNVPVQKTGVKGVFENRETLPMPYSKMKKDKLHHLVGQAINKGLLEIANEHPTAGGSARTNWLKEVGNDGLLSIYADDVRAAAKKSKTPLHFEKASEWRNLVKGHLAKITDDTEFQEFVSCMKIHRFIAVSDDGNIQA